MGSEHADSTVLNEYTVRDLLQSLGGFGTYQKRRAFLMLFLPLTITLLSGTTTFTLPDIDAPDPDEEGGFVISCVNGTNQFSTPNGTFPMTDKRMMTTATEDFDMICDNDIWLIFASDVFYAGQAIGAVASGQISDKYGRHPVLIASESLLIGSALISALTTNFPMFMILRFFIGFGHAASYVTVYSLVVEMVNPHRVLMLGFLYASVFSLGSTLLSVVAFHIRRWRLLQIVNCLIALPSIPIAIWSPESLRWLIARGNIEQAKELARKQAQANKVVGKRWLLIIDELCAKRFRGWSETDKTTDRSYCYILDILKTDKLNMWIILLAFSWLAISSASFGIGTALIPGELFQNLAISGLVPFLALPVTYLVAQIASKLGRKDILVVSMLLCSACCWLISVTFFRSELTIQIFAQAARTLNLIEFATLFVYTLELIPTSVRSSGLAFCLIFARLGSIITPWVNILSTEYWGPTAYIIYGSLLLVGAFSLLYLPETFTIPSQDTLEDSRRVENRLDPERETLLKMIHQSFDARASARQSVNFS